MSQKVQDAAAAAAAAADAGDAIKTAIASNPEGAHIQRAETASTWRWDTFKGFLRQLVSNPALIIALKYVILFVALYLIYKLYRNELGFDFRRSGRPGQERKRRDGCLQKAAGCRKTVGGFAIPGTGGRPFGHPFFKPGEYATFDPKTYATLAARPRHAAGRCDNASWVEVGDRCASTQLPPPIEWKLKLDENPEFSQLSKNLRQVVAKFDTIVLPWTLADDYLVPDCAGAYYKADPQRRRVAGLEDEGDRCLLAPVAPTVYSDRVRHKAAALDDFSEVEVYDCGNGECGV